MKYLLFVFTVITFFSVEVTGQNQNCTFSLEGYVYDLESETPLSFVSVLIENTQQGTTTNEDGFFRLENLCEKEYDLVFSYLGYKTISHHHDYTHPGIKIYLAPEGLLLESVIIEGEHSQGDFQSGSSTTLSGEELRAVQSESLGDALRSIAGVQTVSTGQNVVKPVIHGLHSNRILIVNNGLRHEFQNWGTDHAPEIDPGLAENIEVIKGAATVRFGPDALGGVVLLNSAQPELSTPFSGNAGIHAASNGKAGEASLQLQKGFKWWSVMAQGNYLKQGDLKAPDYQLTNTGKEEYSYAAGLRFHLLPELDVEAYYSHFDQELGILRGAVNGNLDDLLQALNSDVPNETRDFSYDINTPKQGISHDLIRLKGSWIGEKQSVQVQYGYQFNKRQEFDVRKGNDLEIPNIDLELRTQSLDVDWRHPALGNIRGKLGLQWLTQDNENIPGTNTVPFIPNYKNERLGTYLIESLELGKHVLEAGIRFDYQKATVAGRQPNNDIYRNSFSFENLTASLGYKVELDEVHTFRTNVATAWRPPSIAELYRFGRHLTSIEYGLWRYQINESGAVSASNILTEEERPVKSEAGLKWINTLEAKKENVQLEFTAYVNQVQNYIYARPAGLTTTVRGTAPYYIYDQADLLIAGLDAAGRFRHSSKWMSTAKFSWLWSKQIENWDNAVNQPPAQLTYGVDYQPKIKFLDDSNLNIEGSYTFRQYQEPLIISVEELLAAEGNLFTSDSPDFDILSPPNGYFLLHLSWRAQIGHVRWRFSVDNLLNTSYRNYTNRLRYFADETGRNIRISISYDF